jgi:CheY-like chemotaxis protein/CHASE3 domain sensor protein
MAQSSAHSGPPLPPSALAGFTAALLAVILMAILSYQAQTRSVAAADAVTQGVELIVQVQNLLSSTKDAETGQRGFLLTGDEAYLEPFTSGRAAINGELDEMTGLTGQSPEQRQRVDQLRGLIAAKLDELQGTITLKRAGKTEQALEIVRTDRGKVLMDRIRTLVTDIETTDRAELAQRQQEWQRTAILATRITWIGSIVLLVLIGAAAALVSRDYRARQLQSWLRTGQMGLSERIQGDQTLESLGENVMGFLAHYLGAQVGAIYIAEGPDRFRRFAGYALPAQSPNEMIHRGDSLVGQAVKDNRLLHLTEVPPDYVLPVNSSIGKGAPREILIAPASIDRTVHAAVEFGFLGRTDDSHQQLLVLLSTMIAVAVRSSKDRTRLEQLLEETQRQAEELQTQQEELRVNNEELEEQSRALKVSHAQLESQQAELEQTNSQLEEQTQLLEHQKDALSTQQGLLSERAADLQRANLYKSQFLANMSHELRTPLNSTLILAKLLADNKDGNLTEQQVKFARTITTAGNDLLALINDVLDLSKIEAGKIDLKPEVVRIAKAVDEQTRLFQPLAEKRGIKFSATILPGTPATLETDPQRLGQILKNLCSNAVKFTEVGEVSLQVSATAEVMTFTVMDTGVGIAENQHRNIFEAFQQADGSIHRKFGGTGLGLSISRDLAHRLGGQITLQSTPGKGSIFTLTLPHVLPMQDSPQPALDETGIRAAALSAPVPTPRRTAPAQIEDDRGQLVPNARLILIIEDDVAFAAILRDLARELKFQCIVTHTAGEGLLAAREFRPSAILLDVHLPDHSGLGVLEQLKRNPETRHIPVHIASIADHAHGALELGAVGFAQKPVTREHLIEALQRLETKLAQSVRRVLVVEDDERQRESIRELLAMADLQITAVESAGKALEALRTVTFDCMVMDLSLPDFSGFELLERMQEEDGVSVPPVIVYTGRALSADDEQKLRRFSKSIILKDARSPERLLDEVTLFLHQVESTLPADRQRMLKVARDQDSVFEGRRILVVEDDVRNVFALTSLLEPKGARIQIARNGREAIDALLAAGGRNADRIDLVLMDVMMPEMDGLTAMREIRKRPEWKKLPIIALTAKAMRDDLDACMAAGANDYIAKPLDVEKLLSLIRVWMPK